MEKQLSKSLKVVFFVHAIIGAVVGLQHLLAPQLPGQLTGISLPAPALYRLIGAAVFAFAVSSWLAGRADHWASVRIIVITEIVWSYLGAVTITWGIVSGKLPHIEWPNVIVLFVFAIIFTVFYLREREP